MLRELSVKNMALIEDVHLELEPGFCVWTGETGAGKTLLLSALHLLLGERGSTDWIRAGTTELQVAGRFELDKPSLRKRLVELAPAVEASEDLIIRRRLSAADRSRAYVNDQPVTLQTLRQIGTFLVDIHGQRESQSLLDPDYQLELLDSFGRADELRGRYLESVRQIRRLRIDLQIFDANRQQRLRELSLTEFEIEEIDQAALVPGELAQLTQERERLVHAQALQDFASDACDQLYDREGSCVEVLGKLQREADFWARVDPSLAEVNARLGSLAAEAQDLAYTLRPRAQQGSVDPARQEEVELRLQRLRRLEVKYSRSIDTLAAYREELEQRRTSLSSAEEDRSQLEQELSRHWQVLRELGAELSKKRRKAAGTFIAAAAKQLSELCMPDARLDVAFEQVDLGEDPLRDEVPSQGLERLELMLAANVGEESRPLRKVASGGELSRTMLALKTVLATQDQVGTLLVFDEIDANVGGRLGDVLGRKLLGLGKTHQIICITHLPQVASYAQYHWRIRKEKRGKRTTTTVNLLDEASRLDELASMLRGAARSETTQQEAAAMLQQARAAK